MPTKKNSGSPNQNTTITTHYIEELCKVRRRSDVTDDAILLEDVSKT